MKYLRFSLLRLLIVITLVAVLLNCARPPSISFSNPEFSKFPPIYSHWGNRPLWVICKAKLTNRGLLPIWYQHFEEDNFAYGALPSTLAVLQNSQPEIKWRKLGSGESIQLREYDLQKLDRVGVKIRDWAGRYYTLYSSNIDVASAWDARESLPED